jgi:ADP-ribose pyrophosphatase YjhB (NUDIX family)
MKVRETIIRLTDAQDTGNICLSVVLRSGDNGIEVLLARNADWDEIWSLPGGHQQANETPEEAAARELREETGIKTTVSFLARVENHPTRNKPADVFYCAVPADTKAAPNDDVGRLRWWSVDGLLINSIDQDLIRSAVKKVHDPERLVREALEEALIYYPVHALCTDIAKRSDYGLLVALEGQDLRQYTKAVCEYLDEQKRRYVVVKSRLSTITESALAQARQARRLTPLVEAMICAADWLNRWETEINNRLAEDCIVICEGFIEPERTRLLKRGLESDLFEALFRWLPTPDIQFEISGELPRVIVDKFCEAISSSG